MQLLGRALLWVIFPLLSAQLAAASRPPNIILILADDLGYAELGCQGATDIRTPHLDSMAKNGVRCTAGYVTASFCTPSRAGLLTGRNQTRFGHELNVVGKLNLDASVGLPLAEKTLADRLKARGYATGLVGKWHLGATEKFHPQRRGFDEFYGFLHEGHYFVPGPPWTGATTWLRTNSLPAGASPRLVQGDVIFTSHLRNNEPPYDDDNPILRGRTPLTEPGYLTDALARESVAFIGRHAARPFFLYLSFNAPHSPMQATARYLDRFRHIEDMHRRLFAAMVAAMDDAVGAVLKKLRDESLEEQSLIVFLSDNGGPTAELTSRNLPFSGGKGSLLEGGLRVPFLLQWKGQLPPGKLFSQPVTALDLAPTFLAAASFARATPDASAPVETAASQFEGTNLLPWLATGQTGQPPPRPLFWRMGPHAALREGNWKILRTGNQPWRLFDLDADPAEASDLAARNPGEVARLASVWAKWNQANVAPLWGSPVGAKQPR